MWKIASVRSVVSHKEVVGKSCIYNAPTLHAKIVALIIIKPFSLVSLIKSSNNFTPHQNIMHYKIYGCCII